MSKGEHWLRDLNGTRTILKCVRSMNSSKLSLQTTHSHKQYENKFTMK